MAAWRRAIELALEDADVEMLQSIAQSRTEPASRVERARILVAIGRIRRFLRLVEAWASIIRQFSAALNGRWLKVRWPRSTIARARARSQR